MEGQRNSAEEAFYGQEQGTDRHVLLTATVAAFTLLAFLRWPKRTIWLILVAFILQDAVVAIAGGRDSSIGGSLQNADEAILAALLVTSVTISLLCGRLPRLRKWVWWYLAFIVAALMSAIRTAGDFRATAVGLFLLSKGFIFGFVVDQLDWTEADIEFAMHSVLACVSLIACFAIPDLVAPEAFRRAIGFDPTVDFRSGLPSVVSLAGHPGGYGWLMAVGALIAISYTLNSQGRRWALIFGIFVFASALSLRRKPLVALMAAVVLVAPTLRRSVRREQLVRLGILAAGLAIPIALVLGPIIAEGARAYVGVEALTVQARTALYGGALLLARQHFPFGSGVGTYGSYGSVVNYSHIYYDFGFNLIYGMSPTYPNFIEDTFWPQVLGETGVLGLVCYAGALLGILAAAWRAARDAAAPTVRCLAVAATCIGIETLLESGASPSYSISSESCLTIGLMCLAATLVETRGMPTEAATASADGAW